MKKAGPALAWWHTPSPITSSLNFRF